MNTDTKPVIVIGAGLCGTLLAVRLAQRGYPVELYERRPDMRWVDISAGRSINLALSDRGLKALRIAGMEEEVAKDLIPMHGRLIHPLKGEGHLQPYSGRDGEYINSVSRGGLNKALLEKADTYKHLITRFNVRCLNVDLKEATATFFDENTGEEFTRHGQVVIGTDGAGSAVRKSIQNSGPRYRFNFSQDWLAHGYKELEIPAGPNGEYLLPEHEALHIWPRGGYMLIGLPNPDHSFTMTLFMPFVADPGFDDLDTPEAARAFFESNFPDALALMPDFEQQFFDNPTSPLGTVKCFPWQVNGKVLLMGDAAHAIVPFYGQGMNCAFEDVTVFDACMDAWKDENWETLFKDFEQKRKANADAIAELAKENYLEMRDKVADPIFARKRAIETRLEAQFPDYFSKYSLVTFKEDIPYAIARKQGNTQDSILMDIASRSEDVSSFDLKTVKDEVVKRTAEAMANS
ncbi:MAG: FAD-dependent oxidoreductase [Bacteroidia bacterium]